MNNIKVSVFTDCAQLYQRINMFLQENNKPISLWADRHIVSYKGFKAWKMKINKYWFISFSCKRMPSMLLGNFYKSEELTDASWALDTRVSYVGGKLKDFSTCSFKFSSARKRNNTYSITVTRDHNKKSIVSLSISVLWKKSWQGTCTKISVFNLSTSIGHLTQVCTQLQINFSNPSCVTCSSIWSGQKGRNKEQHSNLKYLYNKLLLTQNWHTNKI